MLPTALSILTPTFTTTWTVLAALLLLLSTPIVFGMANNAVVDLNGDLVKQMIKLGLLDFAGGAKRRVVVKTADYTIVAGTKTDGTGDPGNTVFTNRGAVGAVTFTLPDVTADMKGLSYEFFGIADQNYTIATTTADTLLVTGDVAADSLAVSTSSHKIGSHVRVICDGTAWIAYGDSSGDTFTVAT